MEELLASDQAWQALISQYHGVNLLRIITASRASTSGGTDGCWNDVPIRLKRSDDCLVGLLLPTPVIEQAK
jgi:hypothetical protein